MALEMGLWRADGNNLSRITPSAIGLESQLETYIESDPTMLGSSLLIVGRQVPTAHGGFIDLLAIDEAGTVHVLELKRDKTPRDVTAQALDYGSWVAGLSRADIVAIWSNYKPQTPFEEAYADAFGEAPPEDLNTSQVFTIVAASVDAATERIVRFLNEGYGIPINVVFFRHFEDGGNRYLARTWLVDHETQPANASTTGKQAKSKEPWNGQDWYCSFGDDGTGGRNWNDAVKYGFVSGGGHSWYSRTLKNLPVGGRVFACIPGSGYVGVGTVIGAATRFDQLTIDINGTPTLVSSLPLSGRYGKPDDADDVAEWAVAVEWTHAVPKADAVWRKGMFANQNTVAKLRQAFTIEQVTAAFGLGD